MGRDAGQYGRKLPEDSKFSFRPNEHLTFYTNWQRSTVFPSPFCFLERFVDGEKYDGGL
jgi:hypothetical protein